MEEIWRNIKVLKKGKWFDFTGAYEVSNYGRVRSVPYSGKGNYRKCGILHTFYKAGGEYERVTLFKDCKQHKFFVHTLVAFAFPEICGEYFEGAEVDHLDGNPNNNIATNLQFKTKSANMLNPVTYGRNVQRWKNNIKKATAAAAKVSYKRRKPVICTTTGKKYPSRFAAAEDTNSNADSIWQCCAGKKNATANGLKWEFIQ